MISIVIPTYNEKGNIKLLLQKLNNCLQNYSYEVLIVDDNSPDGTAEEVEKCNDSHARIIVRKGKRGLGSAIKRGFKESKGDIIVVTDADFQHEYEKIPEMINEIKSGSDIVIGSRLTKNGGFVGGEFGKFSFLRRIISRAAIFLFHTLFRGTRGLTEPTSGFFTFKRDVMKGIKIKPSGFKILLEILALGNYNKVKEIGYTFGKRKSGQSKLNIGIIKDYIVHLFDLSWRTGELHRFLKFSAVGALGAVLNLGILFSLADLLGIYYFVSGIIAIEVGLLWNFFVNKLWTFKDRKIKNFRETAVALYRDHLVRSGGILINLVVLWTLTEFIGIWHLFSQFIGIVVGCLWNFGGNKWWTWEKNKA